MKRPRSASRRLSLAILLTFAIVSVFIVRLVDLQVVRADELNAASHDKRAVAETTRAERGSIVDADGVVLAASVTRYDITIDPKTAYAEGAYGFKRRDAEGVLQTVTVLQALEEIAAITGADVDAMMATVTKDPSANFAYLLRAVDTDEYRAIRELGIPWVWPQPVPERTYPNGAVAGNLVGFVGTDGPQNGLEYTQNECLASVDGVSTYERGADGVRLPGSTVTEREPIPGGMITTTIDSDLQWFVQQAIAEQAIALGAESGMASVVRVSDGHIVALADYPSVDPNYVSGTHKDFLGSRAFSYAFEPGSVLKAMSAAIAIDSGVANQNTRYTVPYRWSASQGAVVHDALNLGTQRLTLAGVLMHSSNVGIAMASDGIPNSTRYDYLRKFGFGERTAVGFQGETKGLLDERWNAQQRYDIAYGQGISMSLAQLTSAYQAIANGGVRMPLTLVTSCTKPDGTVVPVAAPEPVRVVSEHAASLTLDMLQSVVTDGSLSSTFTIAGYRTAAKTGTGEVAGPNGYTDERIVSVAGIAPADNPEYVVVVTFVKPTTVKTSWAAAPTWAKVMAQVLKHFRVPLSTTAAPRLPTSW
ncbi:MAG: penicillin-binding protein 2 [Cryobacterium sp.]|nr:penicillin-binding protein 2 [Cryobacterium sp.]